VAVACDILTMILLVGGSFFALTGALGIIKMPDFYSRVHPAGKNETLAQTLILTGLLLQTFNNESFGYHHGIKLVFIVFFLFLTTPTATHAITKAAYVDGLKPWHKEDHA
jgi:multicomponent Na+:H+ antiporter subunit G